MAAWWVNPDKSNSSTMLEVSVVYSIDSLQFLLLWGPKSPYLLTSSIIATIRAWKVGLASKHVPLWFNPSLFFLNMIPYLETLAKIIKTVSQVVQRGSLIPLLQLYSELNVLVKYFFHYMQLSHAFHR